MSFEAKVFTAHLLPPANVVAPRFDPLDLSPHFSQPRTSFVPIEHSAKNNFEEMPLREWLQGLTAASNEKTPSMNAHLQAIGTVFERRKDDVRASVRQNVALASYALPVTMLMSDARLPAGLVEARNELHETLGTWAAATRTGMQILSEVRPLQIAHSWFNPKAQSLPMADHIKTFGGELANHVSSRAKDWLQSENKFTPGMSASLVDMFLSGALFAATRKVNGPEVSPSSLNITITPTKGGKAIHKIEGSNVQLSLQREMRAGTVYFNVKDLKLSLDQTKSPKTYALLEKVLSDHPGRVKVVSASVPVDTQIMKELLLSNREPLKQGTLQLTALGNLMMRFGFSGPVVMVPKEGLSPSGKKVHYLLMSFSRS